MRLFPTNLVRLVALCAIASGCEVEATDLESPTTESPNMPEVAEVPNGEETRSLVEVAEAAGGFQTLLAALEAADLVEALSGDMEHTVFAPTDAAFAALEAAEPGLTERLLNDPDALREILLYHVVPGRVPAADVLQRDAVTTLEGRDLAIEILDGTVFVSGAQVLMTDVLAANGVIHVVDAVLVPTPADPGGVCHNGPPGG